MATNDPRGTVERMFAAFRVGDIDAVLGEVLLEGDTVVVFGGESGTVRDTGEPFGNEWCQKYVVNANQIVRMVEYNVQVEPR